MSSIVSHKSFVSSPRSRYILEPDVALASRRERTSAARMKNRFSAIAIALTALALGADCWSPGDSTPHIVYILADDLGGYINYQIS